jgi:hypothetical protein
LLDPPFVPESGGPGPTWTPPGVDLFLSRSLPQRAPVPARPEAAERRGRRRAFIGNPPLSTSGPGRRRLLLLASRTQGAMRLLPLLVGQCHIGRCSSPRGPSSGDWVRNQNASVPLLSIHSAQRSAGRTAACLHGSSRRLCLQWQRHVRQRARARGRGPAAGHRRQYFVRTPAQLRLPGSTEALLGTASTGAPMPCHAMLTVDVATHPPTQRTPHSGGICLMPAVHRPDQMVMSPAGPASSGRDRSLAAVTPTGGRPTSPSRVAVSKPASPHHLAAPGPGGRRTTRPGRRSGSVVTRRARRSLLRFYRPSV